MAIDTRHRTTASETMDDFTMEGEVLRDALDKIASINHLLGGNTLTLNGVKKLLDGKSKSDNIIIIDVGCGNGDMLRSLADYGNRHGWMFKLIGIDANEFTIKHARTLSTQYPNIEFRAENIFETDFTEINCDIVVCTLTLHHFTDDEILQLIRKFHDNVKLGIVINDLHRSKIAYRLFQVVCVVFRLNKMSREDGLVSILRGFKKDELLAYCKKLNLKKYSIRWKWAFRFEWIISKV